MRIIVEGKNGEGRTTVMAIIANALRSHGISEVELIDPDVTEEQAQHDLVRKVQGFAPQLGKVQVLHGRSPKGGVEAGQSRLEGSRQSNRQGDQ